MAAVGVRSGRLLGVIGALGVLSTGCASAAPAEALPAGTGTVARTVDGDTIVVDLGGAEHDVRLIGIDTPESVARDRPVECFGPEAKARMAELLPAGTLVRLERDVEARDRYDRLLAYVIRAADDLHVNLVLVEEGYADASEFPPNTALQGVLAQAEHQARAAGRGLWPVCGSTDAAIGPPPG